MRTLTQSPTVSAIKGVDILVPRARCFLVTWSGNEGPWKQPLPDIRKFLTSGRACAVVTNITAHARNGFLSLTTPLGERVYFLSSEWLLWDVSKMHHFTQLGFTDNLEWKEEDSNRNRLNTLLVCRTETINRQTIVWVMWVFFFFNTFGEQTLGKQYREDRYNAGKSQSKKVSCSMSCNCYLTSKRFLKRNHSCVVLGE